MNFNVHCGKNKKEEMVFQVWVTEGAIDGDPVQRLTFSGNKIGLAHWFASLVEQANVMDNSVNVSLSDWSQ